MSVDTRTILDSGERRHFNSGAVRDIAVGKGRTDLLPLDILSDFARYCKEYNLDSSEFDLSLMFNLMNQFMTTGSIVHIYQLLSSMISDHYDGSISTAILDTSIQYEEGSLKYGEHNWEKGIPCHCYIDSALRHGLKFFRGDQDEPHDRAFIWNLLGLLWTLKHKPELNDLLHVSEEI